MKKKSGQNNIEDQGGQEILKGMRTTPRQTCFLCGSQGNTLYHGLSDRIFSAPGIWGLRKCSSQKCGLVWLDPMPIEEDIMQAYQDYYTHRGGIKAKPPSLHRRVSRFLDECYLLAKYGYTHEGRSSAWRRTFSVYRLLQPLRSAELDFKVMYLKAHLKGRLLLEVGSGSGDKLHALQDLGWIVEGVDFDAEAVKNARGKGLRVRHGTLQEQHYPDDRFDVITMSHLIEHVHDPLALLRECRRILKPDGHLVIVTPNIASVGHNFFKAAWFPLEPPRHLHLYSPQTISSLAGKAGFKDERLFTTIRQANGIFLAGRDIKRSGKHVWGKRHPFLLKRIAKMVGTLERLYLVFSPFAGEELVLVAKKQ